MDSPLVAFAFVADQYEKSGDPIKGLEPLFRYVLSARDGEQFDSAWFAQSFSDTFGLAMQEYVAEALKSPLKDLGLIEASAASKQFTITAPPVQSLAPVTTEKEIAEAALAFDEWAKSELNRLGRQSHVPLKEALLNRLARPQFASIFTEETNGRERQRIRKLLGKAALDKTTELEQLLDYLVARFILVANEAAPDVFDVLSSIACGSLIADAIVGLATPGVSQMPEPPLRVVIDGPLLLDLLDLNTEAGFRYAQGLLEAMRTAGLRMATFDHVVEEVAHSIQSVLAAHSQHREYGPLGERLRLTPGMSLRATSTLNALDERIRNLGIDVLRGEVYERQDIKNFFTDMQVDRMRNAIGEVHHQLERRLRDTKSVTYVIRLKRENRRPSSVLEAGTTFLTRNSALVRKVNHVLAIGRNEPIPRFSIVLDSQLAGLLWFSFGSHAAGVELSRNRLIANCAAAIVPQREIVHRISTFLEQVDSKYKDEFLTLMRDKRASMFPMRVTGGLLDRVDEERSFQILEEMRAALSEPYVERAVEAERILQQESERYEQIINRNKDAVVALQAGLDEQSERFNDQIAQIQFQLDSEKIDGERKLRAIEGKLYRAATDVENKDRALGRKRKMIENGLLLIWLAVLVLAICLSVFSELIGQIYQKAIVSLVIVAGSTISLDLMKNSFTKLANMFLWQRRRAIRELRQQVESLREILGEEKRPDSSGEKGV